MADHKWMLFGLQIGFALATLATSKGFDAVDMPQMTVWLGQEVHLPCGDNSSEPTDRSWKIEDEELISTESERISSINQSSILRIVNVTLDDEGYYTCTAFTRPPHTRTLHLQVKEMPCEAPEKPVNGDFESETDTYRTGDTIRYHCDGGYQLIGESNRTCTGTTKGWQPQEPYCEPEYIGHLNTRLNGRDNKVTGNEDKVDAIERRITIIENNTLDIEDKISSMDNKSAIIESRLTSVVEDVSSLKPFNRSHDNIRKRLAACTNGTEAIDEDTVSKCMTMQLGERDGHSASVYTWTVEVYYRKVPLLSCFGVYHSPPFYHTVPGYQLKLRVKIYADSEIRILLYLVPGEYDDQMPWPFSIKYDLTVLLNNGTEALQRSFSDQPSICNMSRPASGTEFDCYTLDLKWTDVWPTKKHILDDDSVVIKLYLYN